jgi:hypothetical protein
MPDTPGEPAPKSDISTKSTSAGRAWLNPLNVAETRWTTPTWPLTVIGDG